MHRRGERVRLADDDRGRDYLLITDAGETSTTKADDLKAHENFAEEVGEPVMRHMAAQHLDPGPRDRCVNQAVPPEQGDQPRSFLKDL
jgi:hypothetical protein